MNNPPYPYAALGYLRYVRLRRAVGPVEWAKRRGKGGGRFGKFGWVMIHILVLCTSTDADGITL